MKRLIFIFIAVLLSSFPSLAQTSDDAVPAAWLKGINPRTGKPAKTLPKETLALLEPNALKANADGTLTFTFSKVCSSTSNKRVRTWKLSMEAQNLINYAINHRQWLYFIYKDKIGERILNNISSVSSLSLVPYSFESEDSVGGEVPDTVKPEWTKEGMTFSDDIKGDTITRFYGIPMFALKNGNAYLLRGVINDFFPMKGFRDYIHIDNVPASALPFLRFLVKKWQAAYVTYDKATLKVYKVRLAPWWNETIIIGKDKADAKPH